MLIQMFIDLSVCSRAMLCTNRFHVYGIRSQGSKLSNLFLCSLSQRISCYRPSTHVLVSVKKSRHRRISSHAGVQQMHTGWSSETLMVRFVEQDGANTRILATGDANTQMNDLANFRIYTLEFKLPALALKNNGHAQHS